MPEEMRDDVADLARRSLRQALERSGDDLALVLETFGWQALAQTDEAFAFTVLFEELGALPLGSDALDVVSVAFLSVQGAASLIWPAALGVTERDSSLSILTTEGIALRSHRGTKRTILAPLGDRVRVLEAAEIEEERLVGMASDSGWVRVRTRGTLGADVGSWPEVARRARLAVAIQLVAVTQRILDVATEQVSMRRQFGRPISANQSVRFRLAEGFAELAGARALIAAAWEDGSPDASVWAKAVAGSTHDSVAKHALQVCGAIGLSDEHPLPGLVRRGFSLDAFLGSAMEQDGIFGAADPEPIGRY
jgi:Acyl-CoA dehydrogenase, C-terminal domain